MALTERLSIVLETVGGAAVARDFDKVSAAAKGLGTTSGKAGGMLANFGVAGQQLGATLAGQLPNAAAAAAAALAGFGVSSVNAYQDLAQSVLQFKRASGATAEQSSALVAAFDDFGISAETGAKAVFQLGKRLEDNTDGLAAYGVAAVRGKDGNTDLAATLLTVADAYANTTDPARRAALVTAAFGRSGQELIPILERGSEGIRRLYADAEQTGQILDDEDLDRAEDFRLAMDDLQDAFREFQLVAGETLVPLAQRFAELTTTGVEFVDKVLNAEIAGDSWVSMLFQVLNPLESLIGASGITAESLHDVTHAADYQGRIVFNAKGKIDDAAESNTTLGRKAKEAAEALEEQNTVLQKLDGTLMSANTAERNLAQAEQGVVDAQSTLNDLLKQGAVDLEKVADATRSLESAQRSLGGAQRDQKRAQEEYNEALANFQRFGSDAAADKLADASDKLADANDRVADAQGRVTDAQGDLAKAKAGDPDYQDKLARARQGVADATFNVSQKALENEKAQRNEAAAIKENADQVQRLVDLYGEIIEKAPKAQPALAPLLATLYATGHAPDYGGGGDFGPAPSPTSVGPPPAGNVVNNNVTINSSAQRIDPAGLARAVIWELN
jgi:hypothetical protein